MKEVNNKTLSSMSRRYQNFSAPNPSPFPFTLDEILRFPKPTQLKFSNCFVVQIIAILIHQGKHMTMVKQFFINTKNSEEKTDPIRCVLRR